MSAGIEAEGAARSGPELSEAAIEAAVKRVGSLQTPALYFESKRRLLELLGLFAEHRYVSLEDVAAALDRSSELVTSADLAILRQRVRNLKEALQGERLMNGLAAWELEEAELGLANERDLVRESFVRIASLETQLKDARRTTLKLIAALRNGLATLRQVRDRLAPQGFAAGALTPLVHNFQELTQVIQELHTLAAVKAQTAPVVPSGA